MNSKKTVRVVIKSSRFSCDAWFTPTAAIRYAKKVYQWWNDLPIWQQTGSMDIQFKTLQNDKEGHETSIQE